MRETVSAERLSSLVRVHADRVHDALRRLGCGPQDAARTVEASALDLVDEVAGPGDPEPLGWWFARARELAAQVPGSPGEGRPVGEGVLASDSDQALLGAALGALPERARFALLLRDSYDLPAAVVGAALGTTADGALEEVGRARLDFLPGIDGEPAAVLADHAGDLGVLARLGEGGPVEARDATARRHAQACTACRGVVEAQDWAHRLLGGLVVVALPNAEREPLLQRVEQRAREVLPAGGSVAIRAAGAVVERTVRDEDEDDVRRRVLSPLGVLLGLVLAVAAGLGLGLLLVRSPGGISVALAGGGTPLVTAPPLPRLAPAPADQVRRAQSPPPAETRVFTLPPATTAPPPPPPPPPSPDPVQTTAAPSDAFAIRLDPASGPNGQELQVSGTGWTPGAPVTIEYLDTLGQRTGSSATAVADGGGAFSVQLAAQDPQNLPGEHEVRASEGARSASALYDAQA